MSAGKAKSQPAGSTDKQTMVTRSRIRVQPGVSNGKGTVGQQSSSSAGASGKNSAAKVIATGSGPAAGQSGRCAKGAASKVAYLEPIDFGKEIPTQPAAVGKLLHGAGFDRCEEITKIGRFRYKVDLKSGEDFTRLSKLNLTSANLKFFMPASQTETICFVRNVPLDFGDEEMKEQMECEFPITKVERIMRMGRNQQLGKTSSLKVTVQGKEVPRAIKIYGCGFRAELYIFPVKQCSLCWKFGHTKKVCRGEAACQNCGAVDCTDECPNQARCRNCKKGHGAADRNCPERTRRKAIVQEMVKKRIPFAEAEQALVKTSNGFAALTEVTAPGITETVEAGTSYSSAVRRHERRQSISRDSRSDYDDSSASAIGATKQTGEGSRSVVMLENVHKATEFEVFIDQLRKLFLQHQKTKAWLAPLIHLRDKITNTLKNGTTGIELDALLIQISTELNNIIENESNNIDEHRIENHNNNG